MSEVKALIISGSRLGNNGQYVRIEEYAELKAQRDALAESFDELVKLAGKVLSPENAFEGVDAKFAWKAKANPTAILAIAEAFRALEQRAEAAEAKLVSVTESRDQWKANAHEFSRCADRLEAKLAEMEKQEPIYQVRLIDGGENCSEWVEVTEEEFNTPVTDKYGKWEHRKLFTRPAPAINLAELVPDGKWINPAPGFESEDSYSEGWNACRVAILRKIEEAK